MKITGKTPTAGNTKDVEIIVSLKYSSNFWRTLERPLINDNVNFVFSWSPICVVSSATGEKKIKITDTKFYVPVVTLPAQDNAELLQQLKSGLKRQQNGIYQSNICTKQIFKSLGWSEFSRNKQTFCVICWKWTL